jgi:hypothetical protein
MLVAMKLKQPEFAHSTGTYTHIYLLNPPHIPVYTHMCIKPTFNTIKPIHTALKMSYVREVLGEFQASLALLSELISEQAVDGVDLSYIIFKAAVILKQLGQAKQSIEYLGMYHMCVYYYILHI